MLDIERISAIVQDVWGLGERKYIQPSSIIEPARTISFSYKWLGERKTHFHAEWDSGHRGMIEKAHEVLNEATHLIGWNSAAFDVKHLRSHFFQYDMKPTSPHVDIDLMRVVKKNFSFLSNRMAYIADILGLEGKAETVHGLWHDLRSDEAGRLTRARKQMARYNRRDVELTEELFELLRPWVHNLNLPLYEDPASEDFGEPRCTNCPSRDLKKDGWYRGTTRVYQKYQCRACGKYTHGKNSLFTTESRGI